MISIPISVLVLLPVSLKRDVSSLRIGGLISILSLAFTMIVLLAEAPFYNKVYSVRDGAICPAFIFDINLFNSCSLVFFAYTCQINILPIYSELVRPDEARINKVIRRAISIDLMFYIIVAAAGYFSTFNFTTDNVLKRDPLPSYDPDYTIIIASVAICLVLFTSFPSQLLPWRN